MDVTPAFKTFEYFMKLLQRHRKDKIHYLLRAVNAKFVRAVVEIAYNLIKGDIPLSKLQIQRLKCNKNKIKFLINKRKSLEQKKELLCENPELLKYMLKIVLQ